jgi:glycine oxidase
MAKLEPELRAEGGARFIEERSVDPRALAQACAQAARAHGAHIASGEEAVAVEKSGSGLTVATKKSRYEARYVVNCCGAWSGQIDPYRWPTRPVKGQILCVLPEKKDAVRHVLRSGEVYVVPRSDGRVLIGSTMEEAGFDKSVQVETIQGLRAKAAKLAPALGEAKMHDAWAGLRPALPDGLPILSGTPLAGYFVATGHLRDGILLAPVTARVMTAMVSGKPAGFDLEPFRAARFLPPS